jgi:NTE family protein
MKVGVVFSAGGTAGHAYHAGVLAALADVTGWDPREAEVVVGTSAGSAIAALLRGGMSARDIWARLAGEPLSEQGRRLIGGMPRVSLPSRPPAVSRGPFVPSAPELFMRAAAAPGRIRAGTLLAAALPEGQLDTEAYVHVFRPMFGRGWPDRALWICAVSLEDGRRVVFGREGAPATDVATAVAASSAVPAMIAPVTIGGVRYIDGGAHSATNADLVAGLGLDVVIVSASMSVHPRTVGMFPDLPMRLAVRARLAAERRRVARSGSRVLLIEPRSNELNAMGLNPMDPTRRSPIAHAVRESTRERMALGDLRRGAECLR